MCGNHGLSKRKSRSGDCPGYIQGKYGKPVKILIENKVKVGLEISDSHVPLTSLGRERWEAYKKKTRFIVSNPPSSEGDDGFEFRRIVLREASPAWKRGCRLSWYFFIDIVSSSDWLPFDVQRSDLLLSLEGYLAEERRIQIKSKVL